MISQQYGNVPIRLGKSRCHSFPHHQVKTPLLQGWVVRPSEDTGFLYEIAQHAMMERMLSGTSVALSFITISAYLQCRLLSSRHLCWCNPTVRLHMGPHSKHIDLLYIGYTILWFMCSVLDDPDDHEWATIILPRHELYLRKYPKKS